MKPYCNSVISPHLIRTGIVNIRVPLHTNMCLSTATTARCHGTVQYSTVTATVKVTSTIRTDRRSSSERNVKVDNVETVWTGQYRNASYVQYEYACLSVP